MSTKIGRNQSCPCGSGQKFKRCHGRIAVPGPTPAEVRLALDRHQASEQIRQNQQGLGRPIIGAKIGPHQVVAVRNKVHASSSWKTFPDFLSDYLKRVIDPAWGDAEIAKPFQERHPLMQWYDAFCRYQQASITIPGQIYTAAVNGVTACYLGLAYSLYLLDHNVQLQKRLLTRLRDPANFQGAYYELMVANILIRAGFALALEDETDRALKHCEFAAISKHTGKRYWVEAKMRAVAGLLGRSEIDGTTKTNPISRLIPHLNEALGKPAADERLIFIDLNTEPDRAVDGKPVWADRVVKRLEEYESKELPAAHRAYLFVTNMAYHRSLDQPTLAVALPFGLGIEDFNRPGYMRLSEGYRRKQKHIDAYRIGETFAKYTQLPQTFDGTMPSEAFGRQSNRVLIGEAYRFADRNGEVVGTVTTATVNEPESAVYVGIHDEVAKRSTIHKIAISAEELADYRANRDHYFGKHLPAGRQITDQFEMFEWLMEANKGMSRVTMLAQLSNMPYFEALKAASDEELLTIYCECILTALKPSGPAHSSLPGESA
jgi:hypothetical protein